jgi:acetyl-CoA synthetase
VLHLLTLLSGHPDGIRADEVAEALDKSVSSAYSLLDTLCQEGFAVHVHGTYRPTAQTADVVHAEDAFAVPAGLTGVVDELFARTNKRVYLAAARRGDVVIGLVRGRQGMPRIPGLGQRVRGNAHALALGKIALSLLDDAHLNRYLARDLRRFTAHTITDPAVLRRQLEAIRAGGIAFDREELAENFCCLAAPVRARSGRVVAALGLSMSARCFTLEREELERVLGEVSARASTALTGSPIPAIPEETAVLAAPVDPSYGPAGEAVQAPVHTGEEAAR